MATPNIFEDAYNWGTTTFAPWGGQQKQWINTVNPLLQQIYGAGTGLANAYGTAAGEKFGGSAFGGLQEQYKGAGVNLADLISQGTAGNLSSQFASQLASQYPQVAAMLMGQMPGLSAALTQFQAGSQAGAMPSEWSDMYRRQFAAEAGAKGTAGGMQSAADRAAQWINAQMGYQQGQQQNWLAALGIQQDVLDPQALMQVIGSLTGQGGANAAEIARTIAGQLGGAYTGAYQGAASQTMGDILGTYAGWAKQYATPYQTATTYFGGGGGGGGGSDYSMPNYMYGSGGGTGIGGAAWNQWTQQPLYANYFSQPVSTSAQRYQL